MWIIDRYLLRQFLKAFVICFLSLTGLYIVFHAFTNLEDFMKCADKRGGGFVALVRVMLPFYAYQSIMFFEHTSALLTLVAAMFTVTWLQRFNELTALMSAGISRVRVVTPIICAAIVLSLLGTLNRELLIPKIRGHLGRTPSEACGETNEDLSFKTDQQTDIFIAGRSGNRREQCIESPDFRLSGPLARYGRDLLAANAYYQRAEKGRPSGYLFRGVTAPKLLATKPSLQLGDKRIIITPLDRPDWLKADECFVVSNLEFDQLIGDQMFRGNASTLELIRGLHNPSLEYTADVRVAVHARLVQPILDVTLLFMGLPLVVSRQTRNIFLSMALCLMLVLSFLALQMGFQMLGTSAVISPALAAWIPLMISIPSAVGLAHAMWQ
jgi:lipopolysaccharide export system permease protein